MGIVTIIISISSIKKGKLSSWHRRAAVQRRAMQSTCQDAFQGQGSRCHGGSCALRRGLVRVSPTPSISHQPGAWLGSFPHLGTEGSRPHCHVDDRLRAQRPSPRAVPSLTTWAFRPPACLPDSCLEGRLRHLNAWWGEGGSGRGTALLEIKRQSETEALLSYQTRAYRCTGSFSPRSDGFSISMYLFIYL